MIRPLRYASLWDRLALWLAAALPHRVVYWCAVRLIAHATQGKYSDQVVPALRAMDALERWGS